MTPPAPAATTAKEASDTPREGSGDYTPHVFMSWEIGVKYPSCFHLLSHSQLTFHSIILYPLRIFN